LETHIQKDGENSREWELHYWKQQTKSMMRATAQVTSDLWEYAMEYMEANSQCRRSRKWKSPSIGNMKLMRSDAALIGQICAGIDIAKAKRLLTFFIDETELDCSSLQSMIVTMVNEDGIVQNKTLDGVVLLAMKTAEAAADATAQTFTTTREMLQVVKKQYIDALRNRDAGMAGMTERQWVEEFGTGPMSEEQIQASALEMFGDPDKCHEVFLTAGSSDHCGGAQAALRGFKNKKKARDRVREAYGAKWEEMSESERSKAVSLALYGCQQHLRNICFGRGHAAVDKILREQLAEDIEKLKQKGIRCVDGKVDMTLRSIFKFFGSTTLMNYLSVGKEFREWVADHPDHSEDAFLSCGRCDLGNRQDGISEHCFKMTTRTDMMQEFIGDFHWDSTDCNYWPAIDSALGSPPLQMQRTLYALIFEQVQ
jgi:hypothetical protein